MGLSIQEVILEVRDQWMDIDGVNGVGEGKVDDKACILVFAVMRTLEIERAIPQEYKGFPVKITETGGDIRAQMSHPKKSAETTCGHKR